MALLSHGHAPAAPGGIGSSNDVGRPIVVAASRDLANAHEISRETRAIAAAGKALIRQSFTCLRPLPHRACGRPPRRSRQAGRPAGRGLACGREAGSRLVSYGSSTFFGISWLA